MSILSPIETKNQKDKALVGGQGYELYPETKDLKIVANEYSILQAVQNRVLAERGSWVHDEEYGSTLYQLLKKGNRVSETELSGIIEQALKPMVKDGRLDKVIGVTLLDRSFSSVTFEIKLLIGSQKVQQTYKLNFL